MRPFCISPESNRPTSPLQPTRHGCFPCPLFQRETGGLKPPFPGPLKARSMPAFALRLRRIPKRAAPGPELPRNRHPLRCRRGKSRTPIASRHPPPANLAQPLATICRTPHHWQRPATRWGMGQYPTDSLGHLRRIQPRGHPPTTPFFARQTRRGMARLVDPGR